MLCIEELLYVSKPLSLRVNLAGSQTKIGWIRCQTPARHPAPTLLFLRPVTHHLSLCPALNFRKKATPHKIRSQNACDQNYGISRGLNSESIKGLTISLFTSLLCFIFPLAVQLLIQDKFWVIACNKKTAFCFICMSLQYCILTAVSTVLSWLARVCFTVPGLNLGSVFPLWTLHVLLLSCFCAHGMMS